jgi:hypothetical protein
VPCSRRRACEGSNPSPDGSSLHTSPVQVEQKGKQGQIRRRRARSSAERGFAPSPTMRRNELEWNSDAQGRGFIGRYSWTRIH